MHAGGLDPVDPGNQCTHQGQSQQHHLADEHWLAAKPIGQCGRCDQALTLRLAMKLNSDQAPSTLQQIQAHLVKE